MQFTVGQTVIHPHHGPAEVRGLVTRTVKGRRIDSRPSPSGRVV